jgi:hypothetical protein
MKRYLLGLRSGDFNKNGRLWITDPINLYNNKFYKNYSYKRSQTGLNLIGDYTFVGTELTSPSYSGVHAATVDQYVKYATNYGEVVYEPATPDVLRFIDYTSRVDIISFKSAFTNYPGSEVPTFTFQIYESDTENGPWLRSVYLDNANSIFLKRSKPYIKIEIEIFSEIDDFISEFGLLLYVEVAIAEPITEVVSDAARSILRRFPSWTEAFEDSIEAATPELSTPVSNTGKFVNALVGENLDSFYSLIDENNLNSYIGSADESMLDWLYISYGAPAGGIDVYGNGIKLAKAGSLQALYSSKKEDYIYYHNLLDSQIVTLRSFDTFTVDGSSYEQEPAQIYNVFDEFGARVNLPRLYLENNSNFKKRILDVYANRPGVGIDAFNKTLRRELDLWRAYGSTPDSNYLGATPEILEISDLETSSPYFTPSGAAEDKFISFVRFINETYPSNMGYAEWDQAIWDYAGLNGEGVGRIPSLYDTATPLDYTFQPGVGDFRDLQLVMPSDVIESATTSFNGYFDATGFRINSYDDVYGPIQVGYEYSAGYTYTGVDPDAANPNAATPFNGGVAFVYEVTMPAHDSYATPATYYVNLSHEDRDDLFVYNYYGQNSPASPEYNYISIVNSDGMTNTDLTFRDKQYDYIYINTGATPYNNSLNISKASNITLKNRVKWNHGTQSYVNVPVGSYRIRFDEDPRGYLTPTSNGQAWSLATPSINYINSNVKIGSKVYGTKQYTNETSPISGKFILNDYNGISEISDEIILINDLKNNITFPLGATPASIYVRNVKISPSPLYKQIQTAEVKDPEYGGVALNPLDGSEYYVPSSPNIVARTYASAGNLTSPLSTEFFEAATVNYTSPPEVIKFSTGLTSTPYYPFKQPVWVEINSGELTSTPMLGGYIDDLGNVYKSTELIEDSGRSLNSKVKDNHLSTFYLDRATFGITPQQANDYIITKIKAVSNNPKVDITQDKSGVMPAEEIDGVITIQVNQTSDLIKEMYNPISGNYYYSEIEVYAKKNLETAKTTNTSLETNEPHIHTGWLYLDEQDYYAYAKPTSEYIRGQYFSYELNQIPRQGAPTIINVVEDNQSATVQYQELMFPNDATPGSPTFENTEYVTGSYDGAVYLSSGSIYNVSITDSYTGKVLKESITPGYYIWTLSDLNGDYIWDSTIDGQYYILNIDYTLDGNRLSIVDASTMESIIVEGRLYEVSYTASNSFYVDKNYYDTNLDSYKAVVYFSSTPDLLANYEITYETAIEDYSTPSGIMLSAVDNPYNEGFVYISKSEYPFNAAKVVVSPEFISDDSDDLIYISIYSYDIYGNPKPYQSFVIKCEDLNINENIYTTNEYGYVNVKSYYSGQNPSIKASTEIVIEGASYNSATPVNGVDQRSESGDFISSFNIGINREIIRGSVLKAAPVSSVIEANNYSDNIVSGYILSGQTPAQANTVVYWRKARTVYNLFEQVNYSNSSATPGRYGDSGYVRTDADGRFKIGPFYSQDRTDPGYWFVSVESELSATPSATPVTITGDVTYWYERYDNVHYSSEELPLPYGYEKPKQNNSKILQRPKFQYNYFDSEYAGSSAATINWTPPAWFPISYYDQYQMGRMGATPDVVETFNNINNFYEES